MVLIAAICTLGCLIVLIFGGRQSAHVLSASHSSDIPVTGGIPEDKKLVLYTSHKKEVYDPIVQEFEARTGIWVEVTAGGTTELMEQIRTAQKAGDFSCDIMFGGGIESYEAAKENFAPYRVRRKELLNSRYHASDDAWTAFTELPIVLIYNHKLVSRQDAPRGWLDLLSGRWDGQIAFADPANSGSSCTVLETMLQVLEQDRDGDQVLAEFAAALKGGMASSSGAAVEAVASGQKLVGITLEETARQWIRRGADLSIVYPEEGTSALPDGCALVREARHPDNGALFLEFITGDDVQQFSEEYLDRRTIRDDLKETYQEPEVFLTDFDLSLAVSRQRQLLEKWAVLTHEKLD